MTDCLLHVSDVLYFSCIIPSSSVTTDMFYVGMQPSVIVDSSMYTFDQFTCDCD